MPRPLRWGRWPLKFAVTGYVVYGTVIPLLMTVDAMRTFRSKNAQSVWTVDSFVAGGKELPDKSPNRWLRLGMLPKKTIVDLVDGSRVVLDRTEAKGLLTLVTKDGRTVGNFTEQTSPAAMVLTGTWDGAPTTIRLKSRASFPLTTRGFHWVTEDPYNR